MSFHAPTAAAFFAATALVCSAAVSHAKTRRIAVIVGNNSGGRSKGRLRYAERDARRVAGVLRRLGGVQQLDLLLGKSARELRERLSRLSRRARSAGSGGGDRTLLFFYYSGHADNDALLMGGTRFPFAQLRAQIKAFPARTAVAFVDACQAGQMTRLKGGRMVPVMDVRFDDQSVRGRVFISSSAAGESAQESDRLRASFFTHYLLSALRGAGDDSGDGRVSLEEAYRFAYRHTLARTSATLRGPQHPSYDMDLSGMGQLVLTWLPRRMSYLVLPPRARGTYYLYRLPARRLVAEVTKRRARRLRIAVAPGSYEVHQARSDHHMVQRLRVAASRQAQIDPAKMHRQPLALASRKGADPEAAIDAETEIGRRHRGMLSAGYVLSSGYLEQAGLLHGLRFGYAHRLGPLEVGAAAGYARSSYVRDDDVAVALQQLTVVALVEYRLRLWRRLRPFAAIDLGASWVWQRGSLPDGSAQSRSSPLVRYRLRIGVELPLWDPLGLAVWAHGGQVFYERNSGVGTPFCGGLGAAVLLGL